MIPPEWMSFPREGHEASPAGESTAVDWRRPARLRPLAMSRPVRRVRVFISSPGDVAEEREKAREVVAQLQRWYGLDRVVLEAVLWEDLPVQLTTPFQQGIEVILSGASAIDVAVFILWSRLGSPLGAAVLRPDGTEYRSGTEREFELMTAARQASGGKRPALFAYVRRDERAFHEQLAGKSPKVLEELVGQLQRARHFVEEHFHDEQGRNVRAYHSFDVPVSFARRLKVHLRAHLDELLLGEVPSGARWMKPPYRGLETFEVEDAPIFFGRDQEVCDLEEALRCREANEGLAFACIVGASGAGKSSLARAGVAASLAREHLEGVTWRHAFVMPRQTGGRVVEGVGRALWRAIPELSQQGTFEHDFVEELARSPESTLKLSLKPALARSGKTRLLFVLDQLEELFTSPSVTAEERARTWRVLEALARSGLVWVLATLRSDFYAVAQRDEGFLRLKGVEGHYDLLPPSEGGLAALITQPAALAGLRFEKAGELSLETTIIKEALAQPDALPLVEYLLTELYAQRTPEGLLAHAAHQALGGVPGAIGRRAQSVFQTLEPPVQASLGPVLRQLVSAQHEGPVTARAAPRSAFPPGTAAEALVTALLSERLLLAEGDAASAQVRVTHEALLSRWPLARQLIEGDKERLVARGRLEDARRRWDARGKPGDLLLPDGLALAEAESLVRAWRGELEPALVDFVVQSRGAVTRRRRAVVGLATVVTLVLIALTALSFRSSGLATEKADEAAAKLAEARIAQSRYLSELALRQKSPRVAVLLALEALPRADERPFVEESRQTLPAVEERLPAAVIDAGGPVSALSFLPGGRLVIVSGSKATLWSHTGARVRELVHDGKVASFDFSADGALLATATQGEVSIWNTSTGARLQRLTQEGLIDVGFAPAGARLLTLTEDHTVTLWDALTGAVLQRLRHDAPVSRAGFSPDGTRLAAAGERVTLWDTATGQRLLELEHSVPVWGFEFSPDGKRLITGAGQRLVSLWELSKGRLERAFEPGDLKSVSWREGGPRVLTATPTGAENSATLWDAATGEELRRFKRDSFIRSVKASPARGLVAASVDESVTVWDQATGVVLASLDHDGVVKQFHFSADGRALVSLTGSSQVTIWDFTPGRRQQTLTHQDGLRSASWSPDGSNVLTASFDGTAALWGSSGQRLQRFVHQGWLQAATLCGARVLTASKDGTAGVWDARTGARLLVLQHEDWVVDAAFDADCTRVVTASHDGTAVIWDGATPLQTLKHDGLVWSASFDGAGARVITASHDGTAVIWSVASGAREQTLKHDSGVMGALFSPDGSRVLTHVDGKAAYLWDAKSGALLKTFTHPDLTFSAAFSPDGTRVVTTSQDRTAVVWSASSGEKLITVRHDDFVWSASFSEDGSRLATASADRSASVWEVATGKRLQRFTHGAWVESAVFSKDGKRLLTASKDGTAVVWELERGLEPSYVETLRARVRALGFCLTAEEREKAFLPPSAEACP